MNERSAEFANSNGEKVRIEPGDKLIMHHLDGGVVTVTECLDPQTYEQRERREEQIRKWKRRLGWFRIVGIWRRLRFKRLRKQPVRDIGPCPIKFTDMSCEEFSRDDQTRDEWPEEIE